MSTYASTLTAPTTIRWADRMSEWGDDNNIKITLHSKHDWNYDSGDFPHKKQYLYFKSEFRYFQCQVRVRRRFVFSDSHDGSWEDWSPWSDSTFNTGADRGQRNVNDWNFANVDTRHIDLPYNTFDFGTHQPAYVTNTNDLSVSTEYRWRFASARTDRLTSGTAIGHTRCSKSGTSLESRSPMQGLTQTAPCSCSTKPHGRATPEH